MKIKIKNKRKFVTSILIMVSAITMGLSIISTSTLSHGETNLKKIYVSEGDTIWSIAKYEKEVNKYYEKNDIRNIIDDLMKKNDFQSSSLKVGQEIIIPII